MQWLGNKVSWTLLLALICLATQASSGQQAGSTHNSTVAGFPIENTSIGGIVLNGNGGKPEAGVWVIAETKSLPVPFRKIVVTDDRGRFLVPDLPDGSYELWVRGYGLKDSKRVNASRGGSVRLQVENAKDPQEAAKIYPADYWTSMIQPPAKSELSASYSSQDVWLTEWRNGCSRCHQLGMVSTRRYTTPEDFDAAFMRIPGMNELANRLGRQALEKSLSDWGTRIQEGEVPPAPPRPTGLERNVVVTQWDWGFKDSFLHDLISTDKRKPTLYPYGKVYGLDMGRETLWQLDPVMNTVVSARVPHRENAGYNPNFDYYHDRSTEDDWQASPHNPMLDEKGRVWITTEIHPEGKIELPKWARSAIATETNSPKEIDQAYKLLQESNHHHQLGYFDTKTGKFTLIDTVYANHHLQFDREGRLWTNNPGDVVSLGMLDTNKLNADDVEGTEGIAQKAWMRIDQDTGKAIPGAVFIPCRRVTPSRPS